MRLPTTLARAFSLGKSQEGHDRSGNRSSRGRSQPTVSAIQRSHHKSNFLYGRQPPTTEAGLGPKQVTELTYILSLPLGTPLLTSKIANLKPPLTRSVNSNAPADLCDVHTWLEPIWIDELTAVIGEEIGPRLDSLRNAPRQLRSVRTEEIIGLLGKYAYMFPTTYSDTSRLTSPLQSNLQSCDFYSVSCKGCRLSQIFQNAEVLKALNVCVKGRKKRSGPWPDACAWLDPTPRPGWEMRWKIEGLPILSDLIIIRQFRKIGGEERLAEAMASIQSEVFAKKEAIRLSVKSERTTGNVLDEIVERDWSVYENPFASSETVNLLNKIDDLEADDRWSQAYANLIGEPPQSSRSSSLPEGRGKEVDLLSRANSLALSHTTSTNTFSGTPSRVSSPEGEKGMEVSRASMIYPHHEDIVEQSDRISRTESCTSFSTAAAGTTLTPRTSRTNSRTSHGKPPNGEEYNQVLGTTAQVQSIYPDGVQEQLGVQSNISVESWAIFNNSPLGKGRANQSKHSVNEQAGQRRLRLSHVSLADYSASINWK